MVNEIRFLPYSGRRITLDKVGNIFIDGFLKETTVIDKITYVRLAWMFGEKYYPLALLMLVTFLPMHLPDFLWEEIQPLYKDNDTKNCCLENLTYRFTKDRLAIPDNPDFYYIPFYTLYAINKDGVLINAASGKEMTWYTVKPNVKRNSKGGYKACRAVISTGVTKILFRHRALALVFKRYDSDINERVINHIDGDPTNDAIENLEWSTYSQNNLHAYKNGLRPNSACSILVKHIDSGEITEYPNMQEASRQLGIAGYKLHYRLNNCYGKKFDDGFMFIRSNDPRGFPDSDALIEGKDRSPRDVLLTDVKTSNTFLFESRTACSIYLGVSTTTVAKYIDNSLLLFGRYQIKLV